MGETPFNLTFETKEVTPLEIGILSSKVEGFDKNSNLEQLRANLDLLEEF